MNTAEAETDIFNSLRQAISARATQLREEIAANVRRAAGLPDDSRVAFPPSIDNALLMAVQELTARQDGPTMSALEEFKARAVANLSAREALRRQANTLPADSPFLPFAHAILNIDNALRRNADDLSGGYPPGATADEAVLRALMERNYQLHGEIFLPPGMTAPEAEKFWKDNDLPGEPVCLMDEGGVDIGDLREQIRFVTDPLHPENAEKWNRAGYAAARLGLMEKVREEKALQASKIDPDRRGRHNRRRR